MVQIGKHPLNCLSNLLLTPLLFQEQQHQRPDPICSRSHRLQSAAIPARRAPGGCRSHRVLHEAFSSFKLQAGPQTGTVQRLAHWGLCTLIGRPRSLKYQYRSPRCDFRLILASLSGFFYFVCFHREPCSSATQYMRWLTFLGVKALSPWPVILSPWQSLSTKGTVNPVPILIENIVESPEIWPGIVISCLIFFFKIFFFSLFKQELFRLRVTLGLFLQMVCKSEFIYFLLLFFQWP